MPRNESTLINRSIRKLNRSLQIYTEKMMQEDWKRLEPKERLEMLLKVSQFLVTNHDVLKTEMQKTKENTVLINFFSEDDEKSA